MEVTVVLFALERVPNNIAKIKGKSTQSIIKIRRIQRSSLKNEKIPYDLISNDNRQMPMI